MITDGESHDSLAKGVLKKISEHAISVYTIGVGTSMGGQIVLDSSLSYLTDEKGKIVITKLNESLLRNIAAITKGQYYALGDENVVVKNILSNINESYAVNVNSKPKNNEENLYFLILITALALMITEIFLSEIKKNSNK